MKKTLLCLEVPRGSVLGVTIEPNQQVWKLKKIFKEKKPATIKCDADQLELYIAKKNGQWLKSKDADVKELKKGVVSDDINALMQDSLEMDPAETIERFAIPDTPTPGDIHVLVLVPENEKTVRYWLVDCTVQNALERKRVRRKVYRLLDTNLAYYDPSLRSNNADVAVEYVGSTLKKTML
ncbi:hypothetical protein THRCLA_23206 [Thraustotheca clavata]|uniref:Crinkler effector protein N-terminal domain-containing protein n=1 Tax=Thraustotheca clavata TaxID=74557 RepID=A0A1V9Y9Z2_9STRA|nr:hypothetical protein THRCLA_23206 [Thraustotheca clavata]